MKDSMKLGTIAYDNKIYNLDYMALEEIQNLLQIVDRRKIANMKMEEQFDEK